MSLPRPTRQPHKENTVVQSKRVIAEPIDPTDFRPSDVFRFEPKSDITMEELTYLFTLFWTVDFNYDRFIDLEPDLQRHFGLVQRL
jgi:hypothetical protein